MADERQYFVICADGCKFEGMTKEQILTAIAEAISTGKIKDVDTGFVTTIKEMNSRAGLKFWVGTQAEYNALETKPENTFCIITDDTTASDIATIIKNFEEELKTIAVVADVDYVIEQGEATTRTGGVDTIWFYRKWKSGVMECLGKTDAVKLALYRYSLSEFPFSFIDTPFATLSTIVDSCKVTSTIKSINKMALQWYIGSDASEELDVKIAMNVVGKWK